MTEHEKETAFLRRLIQVEEGEAHRQLERQLAEAEYEDRVARRAIVMVALLSALSGAALCYAAVLVPDFPANRSQFVFRFLLALGLGSLICLLAFAAVWRRCRCVLNRLRDECRRRLSALVERRLALNRTIPFPGRAAAGAFGLVADPDAAPAPLEARQRAADG